MLKWLGDALRDLFAAFGWWKSLIVIVVLVLLVTFVLWFLGIDVGGAIRAAVNWNS